MNQEYTYFDYICEEAIIEGIPKYIFNPEKIHNILIYGMTGSGKTCCLLHIYQKYLSKIYDDVFIFAKNDDVIETYKKMEPNSITCKFDMDEKKNRLIFKKFYDELNNDKENINRKKLLIIDDYYESDIQKNTALVQFFISGRHLNITCILLAQYSEIMVKPIIKTNCNMFIALKSGIEDRKNMENIIGSSLSIKYPELDKKEIDGMAKKIYLKNVLEKNYNALLILQTGGIYHYTPKRSYNKM